MTANLNVSGSQVKNKCGVFCLNSNNFSAITYKTVKNIWDEWKEAELKYSPLNINFPKYLDSRDVNRKDRTSIIEQKHCKTELCMYNNGWVLPKQYAECTI